MRNTLLALLLLSASSQSLANKGPDFSLRFIGDLETKGSEPKTWDVGYSNVRFSQGGQIGSANCVVSLKGVYLRKEIDKAISQTSYVTPDLSTCALRWGQSRWTFGYSSPEWSQSLGVASSDLFAAYDYRHSIFVDTHHRIYNPGILYEYYLSEGTLSAYVGMMQFQSKLDVSDQVPVKGSQNSSGDFGLAYLKSTDQVDINFYLAHLGDRQGQFKYDPLQNQIERTSDSFSAASIGISATFFDSYIFRSDVTHYLNRRMTTEDLQIEEHSPTQVVVGFETPTIAKTIFAGQYSTQNLGGEKKILKYNNSEWLLLSSRTDFAESRTIELQYLLNNFDQSTAYRAQFTWPNKRLTELTLGMESYFVTSESTLKGSYSEDLRVYFRYNVNMSL